MTCDTGREDVDALSAMDLAAVGPRYPPAGMAITYEARMAAGGAK